MACDRYHKLHAVLSLNVTCLVTEKEQNNHNDSAAGVTGITSRWQHTYRVWSSESQTLPDTFRANTGFSNPLC